MPNLRNLPKNPEILAYYIFIGIISHNIQFCKCFIVRFFGQIKLYNILVSKKQNKTKGRKTMKNIFNLLIIAGIITLIGTAGASDFDGISFSQILSQAFFSVKLVFCGVILKRTFEFLKKCVVRKVLREYAHCKTA